MRIGFDLDKVFIDYPPFVSDTLIDWLFKDHTTRKLSYRFPGKLEQKVRRLSHMHWFRPPIKDNIAFVQSLAKEKKHRLYLVSGRFSFLKGLTSLLLKKYGLSDVFAKMEINYADKQPHLFKKEIIEKYKLDMYIDDDLPLLRFIEEEHYKTRLFWIHRNREGPYSKEYREGPYSKEYGYGIDTGTITHIKTLSDLQKIGILD